MHNGLAMVCVSVELRSSQSQINFEQQSQIVGNTELGDYFRVNSEFEQLESSNSKEDSVEKVYKYLQIMNCI